jgi:ribonuclease HI
LTLITGQFKDTPLEALRAEAGVPSYYTFIERNLLISKEKGLRLDEQHPRRRAFDESIPKRLEADRNHNWVSKTSQLTAKHKLEVLSSSRKSLCYFTLAPWLDEKLTYVFPTVPGLKSKEEPEERRRNLSYVAIRGLEAEYVLYSDGSASGGTDKGGAGVVVTFGDPESPTVVDTLMKRGSILISSYSEEYTAMHLALDWVDEHCLPETSVAIVTDSKSLCAALLGYGLDTKDLRSRAKIRGTINDDISSHARWPEFTPSCRCEKKQK